MNKEDFVQKMKEYGLEVYTLRSSGICDVKLEKVWEILYSPDMTLDIFKAEYEGMTLEEYIDFKEAISFLTPGDTFRCCAIKPDGEQCKNRSSEYSSYEPKKYMKQIKEEHYCSKHKNWKDPLFKAATLAILQDKYKK